MIKKNILLFLIGMFVLTSCEEEIYENGSTSMSIEQYSPVLENGSMKLSGKVSMPKEFSRETAKVGFYVREFTSDMNHNIEYLLDEYSVVYAYQALITGEEDYWNDEAEFLWVDGVGTDGMFEVPFIPQLKQYVCIAFAINDLGLDDGYDYQVLSSKPFFFTGEATARLELVNPFAHQFELFFSSESDIDVGLCWSATNALPNVEDNNIRGDYWIDSSEEKIKSDTVSFNCLDFGDNDVVYLRGYVKKRISDSYYSGGESYKMIYSNVIELRPKELVVTIKSKEDMQNFINSMYVVNKYSSYTDYRGDEMWRTFRGKVNFNYEVQRIDWMDSLRTAEYGDTVYLEISKVNCTIAGKGVIPYVSTVSELGVIDGMTLYRCDENRGLLRNVQNSYVSSNYGTITGGHQLKVSGNRGNLLNSLYVYVADNYGLVQGCKDAYGEWTDEYGYSDVLNVMVSTNQSAGRMVDCSIETNNEESTYLYLICGSNYGYMENCLPNVLCCAQNYGVIKNPYSEEEYEGKYEEDENQDDNHGHGGGNAGGGITEVE